MKRMRFFFSAAAFFLITACFCTDDEPDELSWDFFSRDLFCFENFQKWSAGHADLVSAAEKDWKKTPETARPLIWIFPEYFFDKPARVSGENDAWGMKFFIRQEPALAAGGGHFLPPLRRKLHIEQGGFYRLWIRYFHTFKKAASFVVKIRPAAYLDIQDGRRLTEGCFLEHTFDISEYRRKSNPLPTRAPLMSAYLWEDAPGVYLAPGDYCLELSGSIYGGILSDRAIMNILLSGDPLFVPKETDIPVSRRSEKVVSVEPAQKDLSLWSIRPGAVPPETAPESVRTLWNSWKTDFLAGLAALKSVPLKPKEPAVTALPKIKRERLASMVYFDEKTNAVGTPRQIAELRQSRAYGTREQILEGREIQRVCALKENYTYLEIETEDLKIIKGWNVQPRADASGGKMLHANYGGTPGTAEGNVTIPHGGEWHVWMRYSNLSSYPSEFFVKLEKPDGTEAGTFTFGLNTERNGLIWESAKTNLEPGTYKVILGKGQNGKTYRRTDVIMLTDDPGFSGAGKSVYRKEQLPLAQMQSGTPYFWCQTNPWLGFTPFVQPSPDEKIDPAELSLTLMHGEVGTMLLHVSNPSEKDKTLMPVFSGSSEILPALRCRLTAFLLSSSYGWQPMLLLDRARITVPAGESAALWLTVSARSLPEGEYTANLDLGFAKPLIRLTVKGDLTKARVPYVSGFASPFDRTSAWEMFRDIGLNVISGFITKEDMDRYGIRLLMTGSMNFSSEKDLSRPANTIVVEELVRKFEKAGLTTADFAWVMCDEPGIEIMPRWVAAAKKLRSIDPDIMIYCNPGERSRGQEQDDAIAQMLPYVDVFVPYVNQFGHPAGTPYDELFRRTGKIKMFYTTPCFHEKAPHAPLDMLGLAYTAIREKLDGFAFFCLSAYYPHSNSLWDDINTFVPDQCMNYYPGADGKTLSTRNLEAVREAVQRWRKKQLEDSAE